LRSGFAFAKGGNNNGYKQGKESKTEAFPARAVDTRVAAGQLAGCQSKYETHAYITGEANETE
jgi:hypothetical protein